VSKKIRSQAISQFNNAIQKALGQFINVIRIESPDPPECICRDHWHCPIHGKKDPEPPLKAQVAKALGWTEIYLSRSDGNWWGYLEKYGTNNMIFNYDTDIKLAMEALIDYCTQCDHTDFTIDWHKGDFQIEIAGGGNVTVYFNEYVLMPLSEIICRAIVKHANQ